MAEETSPLKVALLGAGVVGSQVARILSQEAESLRQRIGRPLELVGIGVRRLDVERPGIDPGLFTTDVHGLVTRGDLDLVVEVIGGIEPARSLLTEAMNAGASVITANKALLAEDLARLSATAKKNGVDLYYEAAVAGAIPIIRPLRESLVGDEIRAPTSRARTRPRRPRSWPVWPSTPRCTVPRSSVRAFPPSRKPTSRRPIRWVAW